MRFATPRLYPSSFATVTGAGAGVIAQPARHAAIAANASFFLCMPLHGRGFAQAPCRERSEERARAERRPGDAPGEAVGAGSRAAGKVECPAEHHRADDASTEADHRADRVRHAEG